MTRLRAAMAAVVLSALLSPLVAASPAYAAPTWCKAWNVSGQTWYAFQDNGFTLMFTLRTATGSNKFSGFARYARGDVNLGGTPSQLIRGSVNSDGVGGIVMNIVWQGGQSGQYFGTVVNVQQTSSGTLTAALEGTTVDTTGTGRGGGARWQADGMSSGLGTSGGRYYWPMFCAKQNVVRYPLSGPVTTATTTTALANKPVTAATGKKLGKVKTTTATTTTTAAPITPPTTTTLAPGAVPQTGRVTAIDDVDIYDGPGGSFHVISMMRAGTSASVVARHPDGWCLLSGLGSAGTAWVAEDHLSPARCGTG